MPTGQRHETPCGCKDIRSFPLFHQPYLSLSAVILELGRQTVSKLHSRLCVFSAAAATQFSQCQAQGASTACQSSLAKAWGVPAGLDPLHGEATPKTLQKKTPQNIQTKLEKDCNYCSSPDKSKVHYELRKQTRKHLEM